VDEHEPEQEPLSRSDINRIGRAFRQDWGLGPAVQQGLLKRLVAICDPETEEGQKASARTVIAANKAIAAYMKVQLGQQALDLAREKHEGTRPEVSVIDVVAAAEARAEERKRERGQ
jgi:hypothetical protein